MKRSFLAVAGFASFGAAALLFTASPATAATASSVQSGWWNEASAGALAAPSTTPNSELQVSNGLKGPLAFAAVRFPIPAGASASSDIALTLTIPSASATVGSPTVSVCPTTSSWKPGGDQPAASAPGYDCSSKQANGTVSGSSEKWVIPASWASHGTVSVAVLPTPGPQQPFSQQFDDPTPSSISVVPPAPSSTAPSSGFTEPAPPSPSPAPASPTPAAVAAPPAASAGSPAAVLPSAAALPPSLGPAGASPTSTPPASTSSNGATAAPVRQAPGGGIVKAPSRRAGRIMALVILLATGGALFFLAGKPERPPRKLGSLGAHSDTQVVVQPAIGGIGRFARPRIGPPKRI